MHATLPYCFLVLRLVLGWIHGPTTSASSSSLLEKNKDTLSLLRIGVDGATGRVDVHYPICGNYCGPSWCNGKNIPEELCFKTGPLEMPVDCGDTCCRDHDYCCENAQEIPREVDCNGNLARCLHACNLFTTHPHFRTEKNNVSARSSVATSDFVTPRSCSICAASVMAKLMKSQPGRCFERRTPRVDTLLSFMRELQSCAHSHTV